MATNKDFTGYDGKSKPGAGRQIPAKAQHESVGGDTAKSARNLTQNSSQEDDDGGSHEALLDGLAGLHSAVLGGLAGIKRAVASKNSGSQNLFAGLAGSSSPTEKSWSRNSGSENAY